MELEDGLIKEQPNPASFEFNTLLKGSGSAHSHEGYQIGFNLNDWIFSYRRMTTESFVIKRSLVENSLLISRKFNILNLVLVYAGAGYGYTNGVEGTSQSSYTTYSIPTELRIMSLPLQVGPSYWSGGITLYGRYDLERQWLFGGPLLTFQVSL